MYSEHRFISFSMIKKKKIPCLDDIIFRKGFFVVLFINESHCASFSFRTRTEPISLDRLPSGLTKKLIDHSFDD